MPGDDDSTTLQLPTSWLRAFPTADGAARRPAPLTRFTPAPRPPRARRACASRCRARTPGRSRRPRRTCRSTGHPGPFHTCRMRTCVPSVDAAERPLDVHAGRDAVDVAVAHRRRALVHRHLRQPPRRPRERAERAVRRHLDEPAAVARAPPEAHEPIVRQVRRPLLHVARERRRCARPARATSSSSTVIIVRSSGIGPSAYGRRGARCGSGARAGRRRTA